MRKLIRNYLTGKITEKDGEGKGNFRESKIGLSEDQVVDIRQAGYQDGGYQDSRVSVPCCFVKSKQNAGASEWDPHRAGWVKKDKSDPHRAGWVKKDKSDPRRAGWVKKDK